MSDPVERMEQLRDHVEDVPMRSAAAVRRRGDQLRRRRTVAVTAGAAAAVVAVVVPLAVVTRGGERDGVPPADRPSATSTATPAAVSLTEANLMTEADTEFNDTPQKWRVGETSTRDDEAVANACQQSSFADLGAEAVFQRGWGIEAHGLTQVVAEFPSSDDARSAYDDVRGDWLARCPMPAGADDVTVERLPGGSILVEGEAALFRTTYQLDGETGGESFNDHLLFSGVARVGDRLTLLSHEAPAGDYTDIWGDTSPVERMLPAAADRLIATATDDEGSARTDIPAGLPVDRDLSAPEGDPIAGPGPDARGINGLDICGSTDGAGAAQWPAPFVERLAASAPGPASYLDARELVTLPDSSTASEVLDDIRRLVAECGTQDGVVWTEHNAPRSGEESVVVSRTFELGLGGDIYQFTRVGNAILAVDRGGEWELTSTVPSGIDEVAQVTSAIAPDLCIYAAGGCEGR